jgi:hypothetical protein
MRRQPKAQTLAPLAGNRGFESTSLQRGVQCEPGVSATGSKCGDNSSLEGPRLIDRQKSAARGDPVGAVLHQLGAGHEESVEQSGRAVVRPSRRHSFAVPSQSLCDITDRKRRRSCSIPKTAALPRKPDQAAASISRPVDFTMNSSRVWQTITAGARLCADALISAFRA